MIDITWAERFGKLLTMFFTVGAVFGAALLIICIPILIGQYFYERGSQHPGMWCLLAYLIEALIAAAILASLGLPPTQV